MDQTVEVFKCTKYEKKTNAFHFITSRINNNDRFEWEKLIWFMKLHNILERNAVAL